jgi:5-methylcytosine-specific restriction endonuclease McrA
MPYPDILAIDSHGHARSWLSLEEAAHAYVKGDVIDDSAGTQVATLRGGMNAVSGLRSELTLRSIVFVRGFAQKHIAFAPRPTRFTLFKRDHGICAYCGKHAQDPTAEHVMPESRGGGYTWTNLVTACRRCNTRKAARTPEEAGMPLLYVPYRPVRNEWMILSGRRVLTDQMEFLRASLPATSRHR